MKRVNFWKTLFFTALAASVFAGCSKDDSDDGASEPSITVDGKENAVGAVKFEGGSLTFSVTSSNDWTLALSDASASSWCSVATSGGRGTTSLTFNISKWEGAQADDDRSVTATLTTYGTIAGVSGVQIPARAYITIRQNESGSTEVKTNVAEIRALLKEMNPTTTSTPVTAEIAAMTITGIVVSDGAGNNMYNQYQIAVQDTGTDANSGLTMNATMFGESTKVTPGQILTASLKNAKVQLAKNGCLQLGVNDDDVQLVAGTAPDPIVITPDKLGDYESQFVRIENCQPELDFVGKAWNSGNKDNGGNSGNVTFELLDESATFLVFSSSYASYCKSIVPEKSGYIQGIALQYNGTLELCPRFAADLEGLTAEYQGPEYKTGTIDKIAAGEYWEITGSIVAVNTSSFLLADATGYVLVYNSSWTTTSNPYEIGQKVTVKGKIEQFPEKVGLLQFASPTITENGNETFNPGEPTVFDAAALTAYESNMKYQYVKLSGVLSITEGESSTTGKYYSYTLAVSGYNGKKVTLAYAFDKDFTDFKNGDVVDVTGFASGTNFDKSAINIIMTSIEKNTSTPAVTITTTPSTFAAEGGTQNIAFTVANPGSNKVYAKVEGEGFSVPSDVVTSPVTVTAAANEGAAREATLTIYAAASEGGAAVAQATVTLRQSGVSSGAGYTLIDNVADLTAGTYYMSGYSTEYKSGENSVTFAPYSYHVWAGTVSGNNPASSNSDLVTVGYEFAKGNLTVDPSATGEAALITLEAVGGSANTYYIKSGDKYLKVFNDKNRRMGLADTSDGAEWTFDTHAKGGIKISNTFNSNVYILGTAGAQSNMLRSYGDPASSLVYGVCFFKAN